MPESSSAGPGGYAEVSGSAGAPRPRQYTGSEPEVTSPFTPPDTSALGYGNAAGGATATEGGSLAHKISGTAGMMGQLVKLGEAGSEAAL